MTSVLVLARAARCSVHVSSPRGEGRVVRSLTALAHVWASDPLAAMDGSWRDLDAQVRPSPVEQSDLRTPFSGWPSVQQGPKPPLKRNYGAWRLGGKNHLRSNRSSDVLRTLVICAVSYAKNALERTFGITLNTAGSLPSGSFSG